MVRVQWWWFAGEGLNQTSDSLHWTFCGWGWLDQRVLPKLPTPLEWMRRCWKDRGARFVVVVVVVYLFVIIFWGCFLGYMLQRRGADIEGPGGKQDWGTWYEIPKESIKNYVKKNNVQTVIESENTDDIFIKDLSSLTLSAEVKFQDYFVKII